MARIAISKKLRFEVFKRDNFTCQYCGKSAPDVVLHVDHINPVKRGGKNDILNLVTSCIDCNLGKGARTLDDNSVIERQKQQLQEINERREQLRMMVKWRNELISMEQEQLDYIDNRICELTNLRLTAHGKNGMAKHIKKYGFNLVIDALEASAIQYLEFDNDNEIIKSSVDKFIDYIPRVCNGMIIEKTDPSIKEINYICGIARNRFTFFDGKRARAALQKAHEFGADLEEIKRFAKIAKSWSQFMCVLERWNE